MAQKRTIDIDINTNADQAAKEFDNLGKATKVANDSLEGLNKTFEEANGDIQPLTARMGEAEDRLYELALAGDTTSKEYQGLLNKVGEYRKVQIQTDLAVDGAATTLGQKLGGALNGATSGFAATQGAMALFGTENEALEKSLLKVQAALAIQQGVQGLSVAYRELGGRTGIATKAQAAFNFVMNLNPFVLVATAIVAAIAALAKFTSFLDPAIDKLKELSDFIGLTDFAEEKRFEAQKQRAADRIKIYEDERKEIDKTISKLKGLDSIRQTQLDRQIRLLQAAGKETRSLERKKLLSTIQSLKEEEAERLKILQSSRKNQLSFTSGFDAVESVRASKRLEEALFELKVFDTESARIRRENATKEVEEEKIEFDGKIERLQIQAATEVDIDKEKNEQIAKNAKDARDRQKAADEAERERQIRNKEFAISTTSDTLSLISDITELFGKKGEKQAKRAFNVQKAAQIAGASIETFRSAQSAYLSQFLPIPDPSSPVRGGVAAGIAVAAGLTNVAKIASQKFEGGGASGGSSFSGGDVGSGAAQAPSFNVVGDSGINQLAQLQQAPVQAFVVSGEVTTSQALDRNRVENATL